MAALSEQVLAVAAREGAERVEAIYLRVGSLAGVDPQALRFAAELVLAQTCAEGAALQMETVAAAFWCKGCGEEFLSPDGLAVCPACGDSSRALLRGRELTLQAVDLYP